MRRLRPANVGRAMPSQRALGDHCAKLEVVGPLSKISTKMRSRSAEDRSGPGVGAARSVSWFWISSPKHEASETTTRQDLSTDSQCHCHGDGSTRRGSSCG